MKNAFIFFFSIVLFFGFEVFVAEANHKSYNCNSVGTYDGIVISAYTAANNPNAFPSNGCPANRPVKNSRATGYSASAQQYCCLSQANSDRLTADYNRDHPSSTGGNTTGSPTTTTPVTTPAPTANNACPTNCIDINTNCPTNTNRDTTKTCPSSNLKCCTASASTPTGGNNGGNTTGNTATATPVNITLTNPLRYDTVEGVLTSIMNGIKGIVVTLAILMIVIGGIMYIFSLGNPENMKRAKNVILAALVGLAIVIAAPAFLREISVLLGWNNAPPIEGGTDLTLTQIARNILNFLLSIIGILALIMMIVSGIMYLTSAGNETRMKQARGIFTASLIGITVAMASLVLVTAVARFFE